MPQWSRRDALLAAGGVAVSAATSLAGCTGSLPFGGTERDAERRAIRSWAPAPSAAEAVREDYSLTATDVDRLHARAPPRYFDAIVREPADVLRPVDIDPSTVQTSVSLEEGAVVLRVDHDAAAVADQFLEAGFERTTDGGQFERFERDPRDGRSWPRVAFDGTFVVQVPDGRSIRIEALLDAYDGSGERYVDASESFARLVREAPSADRLQLQPYAEPIPEADAEQTYGQFAGLVGTAGGLSFGEERVSQRTVYLFATADDVDRDAIEAHAERRTDDESQEGLQQTVEVDGRAVRVAISAPREEVFGSETSA